MCAIEKETRGITEGALKDVVYECNGIVRGFGLHGEYNFFCRENAGDVTFQLTF